MVDIIGDKIVIDDIGQTITHIGDIHIDNDEYIIEVNDMIVKIGDCYCEIDGKKYELSLIKSYYLSAAFIEYKSKLLSDTPTLKNIGIEYSKVISKKIGLLELDTCSLKYSEGTMYISGDYCKEIDIDEEDFNDIVLSA